MAGNQDTPKEAIIGAFLTLFFVLGFITHSLSVDKQETRLDKKSQNSIPTQSQAISSAKTYLKSGPLSYPFTYNLTTVSLEQTEIGGATFYNWTVSFTVEPNPLNPPLYQVPANQSRAQKHITVFVSNDGKYMFQSPPIKLQQ